MSPRITVLKYLNTPGFSGPSGKEKCGNSKKTKYNFSMNIHGKGWVTINEA